MIELIKHLKNDKGQAVVFVALLMLLFMAAGAIVVDVALTMVAKEKLQQGLDAGALAGTMELYDQPANAFAVAQEYLLNNVPGLDSYSINNRPTKAGLKLWGEKDLHFFFAPLLGFSSGTVSGVSVAEIGAVSSVIGAAPLAIEQHNFDYDDPYILKQSPNGFSFETYLGAGNFGALSLGGGGASKYEENLKYGFRQLLAVGDVVATETGNISGATRRGVDFLLQQCDHDPACTYSSFKPGCPRILLVPVYKEVEILSGQIKQVEVVGFASFFISEVSGTGVNNQIIGYFVKSFAAGTTGVDVPDFGLKTVRLVKGDNQ
ncbi:Tad domain-containing protein [Metallumcola ferriviriculae]|uniref:Tad domain-containing protein n=1 Tax=Metallumcola ferriviriculae TaxID=3039180 RepID=A0AAU0US36_9FIRM|nr:Tad domain-containing protein [Desulfitibacteraceae bacterium MK1]